MPYTLQDLRRMGFTLEGATRFYDPKKGLAAKDAAMVTDPNTGLPVSLTTFFNTEVVYILTRPFRARNIIPERPLGSADDTNAQFPQGEMLGATAPYSDFSNAGHADANYNWEARDNYLFETVRNVGDLEQSRMARAKINLGAETQRAAAHILDNDANRFAFLGVANLRNYGLLNDPGLNPSIPPMSVTDGSGTVVSWPDKDAMQRFNDVRALYKQLIDQMGGNDNISNNGVETPLILAMSAETYAMLGEVSEFSNKSTLDMILAFFRKVTIVTAPEYSTESGELMQMIIPEVDGTDTAFIAPSEKFNGFAPVRGLSSFSQKFRAGTFGTIIRRPVAVASMLGM